VGTDLFLAKTASK